MRQNLDWLKMSSNYAIKRDLEELVQMSDKLHEYMLSDALYMPVSGGFFRGSSTPQLTTGAFLLRRRRLSRLRESLDAGQRALLDATLKQHDDMQREWRLHYEKKLQQEVNSRLKMMVAFFRECSESPRDCAAAYPVEAMRRTIVQEILLAMDEFDYDKSELLPKVQHCDAGLRQYLRPSAFIWAPLLEPLYPRAIFWWLFARPEAG
ncbi:MAG: hypothetical protein OXG39_17745 [Chloroflexi bacterium]|nr:hypothetical protein [Chloroflexota bacterium]